MESLSATTIDAERPETRELLLVILSVGLVSWCGIDLALWAGRTNTIWPANGILLAILLGVRPAAWPSCLVAAFLAYLISGFPAGLAPSISLRIAVVNICEIAVALNLLRWQLGLDGDLSRPRILWRFTLFAALLAPAIATVLSAGLGFFAGEPIGVAPILASFLAHALGIIATAPFVLAIRRQEIADLIDVRRLGRTALVFLALVATTVVVFIQSRYPLLFLVLPPLVAIVLLYGLPGGALGLLLATLVSIVFTVAGHGPTTLVHASTNVERIIVVQLFAAVAAGLVLVLSAILSERDRATQQLREAKAALSQLAATDALTGLANRRRLDEALDEECRRAARVNAPISFLLLDVDRFKGFNDHYGHQAGDSCLRALASALRSVVRRPGDLAARYGGEELAILLPGTDQAGAMKMAEAVRTAIEALRMPHVGNLDCGGVVTVSVGVATAGEKQLAYRPEALIEAADALLYEAKRTGRNRVVSPVNQPTDPTPPILADETERAALAEVYAAAATTQRSPELDRIAGLAAMLLDTPIGLISLIGRNQQIFVGRHGLDIDSADREVSICAHVIVGDDPLVVPDATIDPRFRENPYVTGNPGIRFYAGAPLVSAQGDLHLGALCVIDRTARPPLTTQQRSQLSDLARLAIRAVEGWVVASGRSESETSEAM